MYAWLWLACQSLSAKLCTSLSFFWLQLFSFFLKYFLICSDSGIFDRCQQNSLHSLTYSNSLRLYFLVSTLSSECISDCIRARTSLRDISTHQSTYVSRTYEEYAYSWYMCDVACLFLPSPEDHSACITRHRKYRLKGGVGTNTWNQFTKRNALDQLHTDTSQAMCWRCMYSV